MMPRKRNPTDPAAISRRTLDLWPDVGMQLGLSRNGTYLAAARGDIPHIRVGTKILVPIDAFEALLAGRDRDKR